MTIILSCMCGGVVEIGAVATIASAAAILTQLYNRFSIAPGARLQLLRARRPAPGARRPATGDRLQVRGSRNK